MVGAASAAIPQKRVSGFNRPYWDAELSDLQEARNAARREGDEEEWRRRNDELEERSREKKKGYWREFVEGLGGEEDVGKVWKTVRCLGQGDKGGGSNNVLIVGDREARSDVEKAECFGRHYAAVSSLRLGKAERRKRVEVSRRLKVYEGGSEFEGEFEMSELERALGKMGEGKKGGPDRIETAFLKHLSAYGKGRWLGVFNACWRTGSCPGIWKQAEIIPLQKEGKDPRMLESFRPVSLTSVCVKLLERMIVERLYCWLERAGVLQKWQAGFQRTRSTEELVLRLVQGIQDGWEAHRSLSTIAVTLDCSKAYDRVWRVRLLERMMDDGVPACMVRWFAVFLEDRKARVRVGGGIGKWRRLQQGLPQGAVSSPALFLLYVKRVGGAHEGGG